MLHVASREGNSEVVKILLGNGATNLHFEKNNKGEIPLNMAADHEDTLKILIIDFLNFACKSPKFPDPEFQTLLGKGKNLFYLKPQFKNKTLLQYLVDQEMMKEREELLKQEAVFADAGNFVYAKTMKAFATFFF